MPWPNFWHFFGVRNKLQDRDPRRDGRSADQRLECLAASGAQFRREENQPEPIEEPWLVPRRFAHKRHVALGALEQQFQGSADERVSAENEHRSRCGETVQGYPISREARNVISWLCHGPNDAARIGPRLSARRHIFACL
ncbi:MAG: hypothetical protein M3R38_38775, partial [Actinomycetota bacterium]|nr:hypothetical protein [Actinomycetota bacterium]